MEEKKKKLKWKIQSETERRRGEENTKKFQAPEEKVYIWLKWWAKFCVSVIKIFCSIVFYIVIDERYFIYCLEVLCNEQKKA